MVADADDVVIVKEGKIFDEIIQVGKKIGLQFYESKTNLIRLGKKMGNRNIKIGSIRPIMKCGAEVMTTTKQNKEKLKITKEKNSKIYIEIGKDYRKWI